MNSSARKIKVAIAGVGNCASSLMQGIEYYAMPTPTRPFAGSDARLPRRLPRRRH